MGNDTFDVFRLARAWPALSVAGLVGLPSPALAWTEADIGPIAQVTLEAEIGPRPVTGISASVVFRDGTRWAGAAGFADPARGVRLGAADRMRIGSQTKTYTGTLVLELVDQGRVHLDDTLARWLPELHVPKDGQITVRDLLSMTSGIADYLAGPAPDPRKGALLDEWVAERGRMALTREALVAAAVAYGGPPVPPIGTMAYSNTNFVLLGMIAEKAICGAPAGPGCSLAGELRSRVIDRVGLPQTDYPAADGFAGPHGDGYARAVAGAPFTTAAAAARPTADSDVDFTSIDPSVPSSAGAMISAPEDETRWSGQLAGNGFSLLTPALQAERLRAPGPGDVAGFPARYGLGIYYQQSPLDGAELLGHGGSIFGYTSAVFRRTDDGTDYAANISTFLLTDQFMAPAVVWLLDRNIADALAARGDCGADVAPAETACSGATVRLTGIALDGGALELKPSGASDATYVPDPTSTASPPAVVPGRSAVPTLAVYAHGVDGIALKRSARLTVDAGAALSAVGNGSTAVAMSGEGDAVEIDGAVTAAGARVAAVRDGGAGNSLTVRGSVTSSTAWWDPALPSLAPSTYMMSLPDDTSAAVVLAGSGGPGSTVTIDGTVRTQRLGTAAVRVEPGAHDYRLAVGPSGRVVGPTVIAGNGTSLDIAPGGEALYVSESEGQLPRPVERRPAVARSPSPLAEAAPGARADAAAAPSAAPPPPHRRFGLGVPGLPPIPLADVIETRLADEAPSNPGAGKRPADIRRSVAPGAEGARPADVRVPPVAVILAGDGDALTVGGAIGGTVPDDIGTTYTKGLAAVRIEGTGDSLSILPTGVVAGAVVVEGKGAKLRIDGTVVGDVTVADGSAAIDGTGRIEGSLTIAGRRLQGYGGLTVVSR